MIVSYVFRAIWSIILATWKLNMIFVSILAALVPKIWDGIVWIADNGGTAWESLTNAEAALKLALDNGFPPGLAQGFAFLNAFVPLGEISMCCAVLATTYIICAVIRVVKSPIPIIGK